MLLRYPEHRPTEIVVEHDAGSAVVRTVVRAIRRGHAVVVEHPRRGRDITLGSAIWGVRCHRTPTIFSICIARGSHCRIISICITAF